MPVEIIGMVGTRDASEIKGPLVDGPTVDWLDGPVIDPDYLSGSSRAHDDGGFDRVLIGYGAVGPRVGRWRDGARQYPALEGHGGPAAGNVRPNSKGFFIAHICITQLCATQ